MSDTLEDCWPVIQLGATVLRKVAKLYATPSSDDRIMSAQCIGMAEALDCLRPGGPGLLAATRKLMEAVELAERINAEQGGMP